MQYIAFKDMTRDQKQAVLAHMTEPPPPWYLKENLFGIKKNGTVAVPLKAQPARTSRMTAKALKAIAGGSLRGHKGLFSLKTGQPV